ncbi:MAG: FAD-binding oxidoreductase [Comamonas sp.]|jgi:FAD/FMN-containing dehydrogenase|uniref:FAD-binding oxidoreductase n=1 Tax=Comamonas sp. TaxID=34028 RepID=UPI002827081F|nr:FAD-binding oxidoreductase [Comamonas sp.]MDR0216672.1 FAD-binding oxidoreductase [Comamonas sp.]
MSTKNIFRRSLLKASAAIAAGSSGLLGMGSALAKGVTDKAAIAARPAALAKFKGEIVTRSDSRYLGWFWAMSWYRIKPNAFPSMFARPTDRDDLALLMAYANKTNTRVVARSSGHNISNPVLAQDAITIDMSLFGEIGELDMASQTIWAGPAVLSEPLNRLLYAKGLSFPSAHTGFVTIGGYLLGGGMGWNMPAWGMGCGSVVAAEVMLADGRIVTASATENTDLYWALRGVGPGFFGIVLRYKLQAHPTPKIVKNTFFYTVDQLDKAVPAFLELLPASNNRSEVLGALGMFNPPGTPKDKQTWHWAVNIFSFGATEKDAQEAARVFTESGVGKLAAWSKTENQPLTYLDLYSQLSTDFYSEFRTSEVALFTDDPAAVLKKLGAKLQAKALDPRSFGFSVLGCNPTVPEPCSFTHKADHYVSWYLIGTTNEDVQKNFALMDELYADLKPYIKGYYINEIDLPHFPHMARECFSEEKWKKLQTVHQHYDPKKRFSTYLNG